MCTEVWRDIRTLSVQLYIVKIESLLCETYRLVTYFFRSAIVFTYVSLKSVSRGETFASFELHFVPCCCPLVEYRDCVCGESCVSVEREKDKERGRRQHSTIA